MRFIRRLLPFIFLVLTVAAGVLLLLRHNELLDWVASRNYQPSATIEQLTVDTTMTPYAKRLFYANRPVLEGKQSFNTHCTDPADQVAVLGCYTGNRLGIYLYDVTEERLQGIEQVTAAHEMLHQAYQRLNRGEKTRINGLLQEYHDLKANEAFKKKIASYALTEPQDLQNEMHSIFGTEAVDLPTELQEYYRQYFGDRQRVLAFHQQYQSEFDKRLAQIAEFDKRLAELKPQIESKKKDLQAQEKVLKQRREQLDMYLAGNRLSEYNAAVPGFNALVATYRADLNAINKMVDEFNSLLEKRNELAVQERELEDAINSRVDSAKKQ